MKYIVIVRGKLKSADEKESQGVHDATIAMIGEGGRAMGNVGHRAHLNVQDRTEFLAVDTWDNLDSPQKLFADPTLQAEFAKLFDGMPDVTIWADAGWEGW
jgi:quinol monooxygenase YgiN